MSSRGRNFRRRGGSDDSAGAEEDESGPSSAKPVSKPPSAATSASKPKPKKPPKLLSFADDEEEEEEGEEEKKPRNNPSRSSSRAPSKHSSHKMTSLKDRVFHSSSSVPSNVQPQAGSYTKEALLELQKNTRTLSAAAPAKPPPPKEPVIVLRGLVKPPPPTVPAREEDEDEESPESGDGAAMPDEKMIAAIKAKRERLRQSRAAAPDFIAIDGGSHHGEAEGLSDEEPENLTRIALIGDKAGDGGPRRGVFEGAEVAVLKEEDEDEDDEEERIWEEEQFRKGLGKNRVDNGASVAQREAHSHPPPPLPRPAIAGQGSGLGMVTMSQQGEIAKKALLDNMKRLKESYGKTMTLLNKTDENLSASLLNITALEKSLAAADDKYRFMQKLRHFVSIICNFLQHKAPFIEELEDQMQQLHEKRASAIVERRAADNGDEMKEVEAEVNAAMSVLGRSSGDIAAAKRASEAASAALKEQANLPAKLDELGRDLNLQKRMEMKRRVDARNRRKARFDMKRLSSMDVDGPDQRVEGESSTDESDSESRAYDSHRDLLLETAAHIFSDASEEFSQLSVVKETFEEWKRDYLSAYNDAYMSLSIPSIFSPYVRLELLKWDPLHEKTDFMKMNWHMLLMDYGVPEDGSGFAPEDDDANIVPELVEKVAVPILHHEVVHCWDMLSTRESKNVADATSLVTDYVPANSKALADLLLAIRTRLADAVANLTVPTWTPIVLQAVPNAARVAAYRFGTSVRLMRNICLWKDVLALPLLEKLVLDDLLCSKILPHVRSITPNVHDAITRTERIIAALYGVWAGPSATGARRPKLQPLVDYVMLLGKMLEKKKALAGATESEANGLARRLKKMLVDLNEYDKARDIARTFHLKEAL